MEMICCVFKKHDKEKHELATEHLIGTTISLHEKGIQKGYSMAELCKYGSY